MSACLFTSKPENIFNWPIEILQQITDAIDHKSNITNKFESDLHIANMQIYKWAKAFLAFKTKYPNADFELMEYFLKREGLAIVPALIEAYCEPGKGHLTLDTNCKLAYHKESM